MEPEIRTLDPQPAATIRTTTTPDQIGATLAELLPEVARAIDGVHATPVSPPFARYHDFTDQHVDIEAGIILNEPFPGIGRVLGSELPGGEVAIFVHVGPYERLGETYGQIGQWLTSKGFEQKPGAWELYVDDPMEVEQAKLRTEIYVPLD